MHLRSVTSTRRVTPPGLLSFNLPFTRHGAGRLPTPSPSSSGKRIGQIDAHRSAREQVRYPHLARSRAARCSINPTRPPSPAFIRRVVSGPVGVRFSGRPCSGISRRPWTSGRRGSRPSRILRRVSLMTQSHVNRSCPIQESLPNQGLYLLDDRRPPFPRELSFSSSTCSRARAGRSRQFM